MTTPTACSRWAFCLLGMVGGLLLVGRGTELSAQSGKRYRPLPDYVQLGEPDQKEGARLLAEFRQLGWSTDQFWAFNLRFLPRRGAEILVPGYLWSTREGTDTLTRIVLQPAGDKERRLLLRNGPQPRLWTWEPGMSQPVGLGTEQLFAPLRPTNLRAFDLLMPYFYWPDFVFEGIARLHDRPAHRFLLYPPAELLSAQPEMTGVRVSLDTQYRALVQSEIMGGGGKPTRTLTLLNLKKAGEQWYAKWVEVRDENTRDKTRIELTAVVAGQQFSRVLFEPDNLAEDIRTPPVDTWLRL